MPPVPSIRGERVVRALERAGFPVARIAAAITSCGIPTGAEPRYLSITAAMWPRERCAESSRTPV
jgi:hypothetical protein